MPLPATRLASATLCPSPAKQGVWPVVQDQARQLSGLVLRAEPGGRLLRQLMTMDRQPLLIGTWAAATWAIDFYEKHGFWVTDRPTTIALLERYWNVPARQVESSVVLAQTGFRPPSVI